MAQKNIIRTPDERFQNLPDFPYEPHYVEVNGVRMHYLDEGKGEVVLCLPGEPSWSYLYRKFIPILSPGYRMICPDLIGFGKSDKYTSMKDYSFEMHLQSVIGFIEALDLKEITVVVQDWGGLLGLGAVGRIPERFARLVIMNTAIPIGDRPMPTAFKIWKTFAKMTPSLPVGGVIKMGTYQPLAKAVKAAYNAPFPSNKYKAGAKIFPELVPGTPDDPGVPIMKKAREVLSAWDKPCQIIWSNKDPIMGRGNFFFKKLVPTAKEQPDILIRDAGHFLQEDKGEEIAQHILEFLERTPAQK